MASYFISWHSLGENICRDMNRGHVATATVCENVLLREHNFVTETCCMKFTLFEFVRHETGTKRPQSSRVHFTCKLSPLQHIFMLRCVDQFA